MNAMPMYSLDWLSCSSESPPYTIFLLSGISVDDVSTPTHIILKNVSLLTSGQYKCEVSGGPPRLDKSTLAFNFNKF